MTQNRTPAPATSSRDVTIVHDVTRAASRRRDGTMTSQKYLKKDKEKETKYKKFVATQQLRSMCMQITIR